MATVDFTASLREVILQDPQEVEHLLNGLTTLCMAHSIDLTRFIERGQILAEQRKRDLLLPSLKTATTEKINSNFPAEASDDEEAEQSLFIIE